jgi:hypothetical protein
MPPRAACVTSHFPRRVREIYRFVRARARKSFLGNRIRRNAPAGVKIHVASRTASSSSFID